MLPELAWANQALETAVRRWKMISTVISRGNCPARAFLVITFERTWSTSEFFAAKDKMCRVLVFRSFRESRNAAFNCANVREFLLRSRNRCFKFLTCVIPRQFKLSGI